MTTPETDRILRNLGVVGRLKANDKLFTRSDFFEIQSPTPFQAVYRTYYGETRTNNMRSITEHVRLAKCAITSILAERSEMSETRMESTIAGEVMVQEKLHLCTRIGNALLTSIHGLRNLQTTYREDVAILVMIDEICLDIDTFVRTIAANLGLSVPGT